MTKIGINLIMKKTFLIGALLLGCLQVSKLRAQEDSNPKVILITLDGFRWQELFTGADSLLIANEEYVVDTSGLKKQFWRKNAKERRERLMPFVWGSIKEMGQIHGNRLLGSKMNLTNKHWFSYPGYNEILSGKADDERITSNDKVNNPNRTILEIANNLPAFKGKVVAFGSWDVFPFIINEERSGVPVNAGFEIAEGNNLTDREKFLNEMQPIVPSPWGTVRFDAFTHGYALEQMKKTHPDLVYISYGETDDFAHDGDYQAYLTSANRTDGFIKELWDFVESDIYYKGNTTFLITTDHGRGTKPLDTWRSHGKDIKGADEVWLLAFGKDIEPRGEVTSKEQLYTDQIAASVAKLLNVQVGQAKMGSEFEFITN
jgi:hypothetical protein